MGCLFEKIIIIGYGVVTRDVLQTVHFNQDKYGYSTEYIEHEVYPLNVAKKFAESNSIEYYLIENNQELLEHFISVADSNKLLIISASNNYLFPKLLIEHSNVTIINFHNALLPSYPGRNAPSWAIFNSEKQTGITWHFVTEKVDSGDIIIQRDCEIQEDIKAYQLSANLMSLASEAFNDVYEKIVTGNVCVIKQSNNDQERRLYKSNEVPEDGIVELDSDPEDIYKLLRAMDYGKSNIFPKPIAEYKGRKIQIKRYKVVSKIGEENYSLYIPYRDRYLMLRYDELNASGVGGVILDIDELYMYINALKKVNRKTVTNLYLNESDLENVIQNEAITFYYVKGVCLNLFRCEWNYERLYYYIADFSNYCIPARDNPIITDIFYAKQNDRVEALLKAMLSVGFRKKASFTKYSKYRDVEELTFDIPTNIVVGTVPGFYGALKDCFDVYTDYVPEEKDAQSFFDNHLCFSYIDESGRLCGGTVISVKGEVAIEEFIFVVPEERGKGISTLLRSFCYEHISEYMQCRINKFESWVSDSNKASWNHLMNVGYKRDNAHKITMVKG